MQQENRIFYWYKFLGLIVPKIFFLKLLLAQSLVSKFSGPVILCSVRSNFFVRHVLGSVTGEFELHPSVDDGHASKFHSFGKPQKEIEGELEFDRILEGP